MISDKAEVYKEIRALEQICDVRYDLEEKEEVVLRIQFPNGWQPQPGKILYDLPETYRREPPEAYIPKKMSYHGSSPHVKLDNESAPRGYNDSNWANYCIHEMPWNGDGHTLVTMTDMLMKSLQNPTVSDPWNE